MDALQRLSQQDFEQAPKLPLAIVLDNVRSGLNVGSVFRTADAFLIEKIWLCGITAQPPHREILKTALGSDETVAWTYRENTLDAVKELHAEGWILLALEQTSEKTWLQDFKVEAGKKYALILGNEVEGVDIDVLRQCDECLEIPQFGTKHSLNVAVSGGIAIWELARQMANYLPPPAR